MGQESLPKPDQAPAARSHTARMRYFVEQVQEMGRLDLIDELVHPEFRNHTVEPEQRDDREGMRATMPALHEAFSGLRVEVLHSVGDGDLVATHKPFRGTHTGTATGTAGSSSTGPSPTR